MNTFLRYLFSGRGTGIFSVTSNQELMIIADSVSWPHGATGLSQGEQCHLLNRQDCFTQSFCGRLLVWEVSYCFALAVAKEPRAEALQNVNKTENSITI